AGGDGYGDCVVGVALAAVADRQHPHPGGQLGRHVQNLFAVADQPLGQRPADPMRALHRPASILPLSSPLAQGLVALQVAVMRCWPSRWPCSSSAAAVWEALWGSTPIVT